MPSNVKAECGLLRVAWAASSESAKRQFLAELFSKICGPPVNPERSMILSDPLGRFLKQHLVKSATDRVRSSMLHDRYLTWCRETEEIPLSARRFAMEMKQRGYKSLHSDVRWWVGVKLVKVNSP